MITSVTSPTHSPVVRKARPSLPGRPSGTEPGFCLTSTQLFPTTAMPSPEIHLAAPMPLRTTTPLNLRARASGTARSTYPRRRSCHTTGRPTMRLRLVSMPSSPFHKRTAMLPGLRRHAANNAWQNRKPTRGHAIFSSAPLENPPVFGRVKRSAYAGWRRMFSQIRPF